MSYLLPLYAPSAGGVKQLQVADGINVGTGIDVSSAIALTIGGTTATAVDIGRTGQLTTIKGDLQTDGAETVVGGTTFKGTVQLGDAVTDDISFVGSVASDLFFKTGATRTIYVNAPTTDANGNNLTVRAAGGGTGDNNGGVLTLDAGAASGAGTGGTMSVGTTNASAVALGSASNVVTVGNGLTVTGALLTNGAVTLGNAAADDLTFTGSVASDIFFKTGANRTIYVATPTTAAGGNNLTLRAAAGGTGGGAQLGGSTVVDAGAGASGGDAGTLSLGATNAISVALGSASNTVTVGNALTVTGTTNLNGAVNLGNASADNIAFTGYISTNVTFSNADDRILNVATAGAGAPGKYLSVRAGHGGTGDTAGGLLDLDAGNAQGASTSSSLSIGATYARTIQIGRALPSYTNVLGQLNVPAGANFFINTTPLNANFTGVNVNILLAGASSDASSLHTHTGLSASTLLRSGMTTTGVGDKLCGYISAAETVTKTDAAALASSRFFGVNAGTVGTMIFSGCVDILFTTDGGSPGNGDPAFLALGTADTGTGAGKATKTAPSTPGVGQCQAEIGLVVDNTNYGASPKRCVVLLQPKTVIEL